jgi:hypothetical protein
MSEPIWSQRFPGGVADASGRHALLRDAAGRCALLRLADGQLLWRSTEPLRPLLVDDELAVALAMAPPRVMALSLQGGERWRSEALPWPEWIADEPELGSTSDLHAAWMDGDVLLRWQLRRPRGGGAGRAAKVVPASVGACRIDRASGSLQAIDPPPVPSLEAAPVAASADPDVLAQSVHAGARYALVRRGHGAVLRTALHAYDLSGQGDARWTCALDEIERKRPPPHRP